MNHSDDVEIIRSAQAAVGKRGIAAWALSMLAHAAVADSGSQEKHDLLLMQAQHAIISASSSISEADGRVAIGAERILAVKVQEFAHLRDLRELEVSILDTESKRKIASAVARQELKLKSGCPIDLANLRAFSDIVQSPAMRVALQRAKSLMQVACRF